MSYMDTQLTTRRAFSYAISNDSRGGVVSREDAQSIVNAGEFIERIGWPKFFQLTGIEFEKEHIDDYKFAGLSYKRSAQLRHS